MASSGRHDYGRKTSKLLMLGVQILKLYYYQNRLNNWKYKTCKPVINLTTELANV